MGRYNAEDGAIPLRDFAGGLQAMSGRQSSPDARVPAAETAPAGHFAAFLTLMNQRLSINGIAAPHVAALVREAPGLNLGVESLANGCTLIDAGVGFPGCLEAGRRIAEISLAGLGRVAIQASSRLARWPWQVVANTWNPRLACLGSQLANWHIEADNGRFSAIGSGPGRAAAAQEKLYENIGYQDDADSACLVLEGDELPGPDAAGELARDCKVPPDRLTLIVTPTHSLAGSVHIVARVLSVTTLKLHTLGFPVEDVAEIIGNAPLPPPGADVDTAMGRTNDAILFGSQVQLFVRGPDAVAEDLAKQLPSSGSKDYGKPFRQIYEDYERDFKRIDTLLFAPAQVVVTALESGRSFHAGPLNDNLLDTTFGVGHE